MANFGKVFLSNVHKRFFKIFSTLFTFFNVFYFYLNVYYICGDKNQIFTNVTALRWVQLLLGQTTTCGWINHLGMKPTT